MSGPLPRYRPVFPPEFIAEANQLVRARTASAHLRQRASLVLLLKENLDISNVDAGIRLNVHPNAVRRWRQRWAQGSFTFEDKVGRGRKPTFTALDRAVVKALACERIAQTRTPLSRQSLGDLAQRAVKELNKEISRKTVKRILDEDSIKPWRYEQWIFPRAPDFFRKAARVLDLYEGFWEEQRLDPFDRIISADEKTSIQARIRCHRTLGPAPKRARRVEHEYDRGGALQYLAAWDVQEGLIMGRCEKKTGIKPFGRLVKQVMERPEYKNAPRVFWIVDNGSSHRGDTSIKRMLGWYRNAVLVHLPVHASWLNQVEIYFSLIERKVLTPNDFTDLEDVELRLRLYEELTNSKPVPFNWKFTKFDLFNLLQKLAKKAVMPNRN